MCFSIPYRVIKVYKKTALIEDGRKIRMGEDLKIKKGDYLRVIGNVAVGVLTKLEGEKIRKLIKDLNKKKNE